MSFYKPKQLFTAGPMIAVDYDDVGVSSITYRPSNTGIAKQIEIEHTVVFEDAPHEGDIIIEGAGMVFWMPPDEFRAQFETV